MAITTRARRCAGRYGPRTRLRRTAAPTRGAASPSYLAEVDGNLAEVDGDFHDIDYGHDPNRPGRRQQPRRSRHERDRRAPGDDDTRQVAAAGCPWCEGPLHRSDFDRKLCDGLIVEGGEEFVQRFSLCCGYEGCRRRATPPSVRFPGRRFYLGHGGALGQPPGTHPRVSAVLAEAIAQ